MVSMTDCPFHYPSIYQLLGDTPALFTSQLTRGHSHASSLITVYSKPLNEFCIMKFGTQLPLKEYMVPIQDCWNLIDLHETSFYQIFQFSLEHTTKY